MIHWQTSYNSVVLTKILESHEVSQLIETNETSYDSVLLTKDTRVIQGLPMMVTTEKQKKTELTETATTCFLSR